jgi:hypothetical protein
MLEVLTTDFAARSSAETLLFMASQANRASRRRNLQQPCCVGGVLVVHVMAGRALELPAEKQHGSNGAGLGSASRPDRYGFRSRIEERPIEIGERRVVGEADRMIISQSGSDIICGADVLRPGGAAETVHRDRAVVTRQAKFREHSRLADLGLEAGSRVRRIRLGRERLTPLGRDGDARIGMAGIMARNAHLAVRPIVIRKIVSRTHDRARHDRQGRKQQCRGHHFDRCVHLIHLVGG